jgi:hypothetical protein
VHEALQKETAIAQEVLRETLQSLENKSLFLEQLQAELNDKSSEVCSTLLALLVDKDTYWRSSAQRRGLRGCSTLLAALVGTCMY